MLGKNYLFMALPRVVSGCGSSPRESSILSRADKEKGGVMVETEVNQDDGMKYVSFIVDEKVAMVLSEQDLEDCNIPIEELTWDKFIDYYF